MTIDLGTAARLGACSLGLLLLSCSRSNRVPGLPAPQTHRVAIESMRFEPADLIVHPGDTIVWENKDLFAHSATAAGRFDSQAIAANASWRWTVSTPGDLAYVCTLHPTMKGTVRIRAVDTKTGGR